MKKEIIDSLEDIVGKNYVLTEKQHIQNYLTDETIEPMRPQPADDLVLVKVASTQEVSKILVFANKNGIPVFARGGGTGLVGGAVPTNNGIILSMERFDNIEIDNENLLAIAEAGVTLGKLISLTEDSGLFFPLHPGDETAQIGGLLATNAGGSRAIKYGVIRNYVKGMEVVLSTGEILRLGGRLQKNNTSYDLMQLIIGSEGTLAVITKAVLRLYPKFGATATLIFPFNERSSAINSVPKILQDGRIPLAIEYVEKDLMEKTARQISERWPVKEGKCYLLIIEAESNMDQVLSESLKIAKICKENGSLEPLFVEPKSEQESILKIRSNIYSALKSETFDILDVTVPPAFIGKLADRVEEIARGHNTYLPTFGHAADGNLHIHIMKRRGQDLESVAKLRNEIYDVTIELGGVITGEHGIGKTRIDSLELYLDENELHLMRKIKKLFDPNNILNPGAKVAIKS